jgi:hypothetical protein
VIENDPTLVTGGRPLANTFDVKRPFANEMASAGLPTSVTTRPARFRGTTTTIGGTNVPVSVVQSANASRDSDWMGRLESSSHAAANPISATSTSDPTR